MFGGILSTVGQLTTAVSQSPNISENRGRGTGRLQPQTHQQLQWGGAGTGLRTNGAHGAINHTTTRQLLGKGLTGLNSFNNGCCAPVNETT